MLATIGVAVVANIQFFYQKPASSVIEIPWSVVCFCIGEILLIISIILLLLIARQTLIERHIQRVNERTFNIEKSLLSDQSSPHRDHSKLENGILFHSSDNGSKHTEPELHRSGVAVAEVDVYEPPPDYDMDSPHQLKKYRKSNTYIGRIPNRSYHGNKVDLKRSQMLMYKNRTWHAKTVFSIS